MIINQRKRVRAEVNRYEIIDKIGAKYNIGNTETGEFSYPKALKSVGKDIKDYQKGTTGAQHQYLDIRFENERLVILVECKNKFSRWDKREIQKQLQDYVRYEKEYSDKKIVAILAETEGDDVWVWYGQSVIIDDEHKIEDETQLRTFEEYEDICFGKVNDKIKVVDSIKTLNEMLHSDGINEKLRSQFVGTCLLALKNGLVYENIKETIEPKTGKTLSKEQVVFRDIKDILEGLLTRSGSINKASKLAILNNKVLDDQDISSLTYEEIKQILKFIDENIVPFINDKNTAGQDLLNLFFTTFNKYVGKSDKNQAFTPDHICDFMCKVVGVNKHSRVLDPCCGSGAFLVRAMTLAMDDCDTEKEREEVKRNQIFGIEYEEGAFGLSSTNMLIHGDGNSNVVQDSMFNRAKWIEDSDINIVLMNPPYNATRKCCDIDYTKKWANNKKEDPSKGFHFVEWVARHVSPHCKMAVLLPMQAAIGNSGDIKDFKKKMLDNYTLDAVFSLPREVFYPGAAAVACCMVFDLSQKHEKSNRETFFGYYTDDKFIKRKGLGRVEKTDEEGNSLWAKTEEIWLDLYKNKKEVTGLSVMKKVKWEDEWLAEAYMETDYTALTDADFQKVINDYLSYLVKEGIANES
jgi:type I restriction-modification system DNA methylase subunit